MSTLQIIELLEATQQFEKKLNLALMYSGLRIPQYRVMMFLKKSGKITVSDLSRHINVSRATMSVLVNQLLKANIVESIDNSNDKRSFYIKLSESGLRRLQLAESEVKLVEEKISGKIPVETIAALNDFSRAMLSSA